MVQADILSGMQSVLDARFCNLRNSRQDKPVFAIEHGFGDGKLKKLFHVVSLCLREHGIKRRFWRGKSLPLLVAASEVGYRYQGTGTDFWPMFDEGLGVQLRLEERAELSSLFEDAHRKFGLKKPAQTRWTRAYRHIAWPIANALAPVEIHQPLAKAVRTLATEGGWGSDNSMHLERLRQIASRRWSGRLSEWLEDGVLAMEVVNRLLWGDIQEGWISDQAIERISADLESDKAAKKALSIARHRVGKGTKKKLPARARLALSMKNECPDQLILVGPEMGSSAMAVLSGSAERSLLFRGARQNIALEEFLRGGMVFLGHPACLPADGFLICENSERAEGRELLQSLEPYCSRPVLFEVELDGGLALAIDTAVTLDPARCYVATSWFQSLDATGRDALTAWMGLDYMFLDGQRDEDCALLERLGFLFGNELDVRILGGLPFEQMADRMVLAPGMPLIFQSGKTGARIDLRNKTDGHVVPVELGREEQAVAELEPGEYEFDIHQARLQKSLLVFVREPEQPEEAFSLEVNPGPPFADDLLNGELTVGLKSLLPLDGVDMVGTLFASGIPIAMTSVENVALPTIIGSGSLLLEELGEALVEQSLARTEYLTLTISVSGLASHEWPLPWRPRPHVFDGDRKFWFVEGEEEAWVGSRQAMLDTPLLQSVDQTREVSSVSSLQLLVPDAKGDDVLTCGICSGSDTVRLGEKTQWSPERLLRERKNRGQAVGLLPVLEAFFAWSLASSSSLITDARRKAVVRRLETSAVEQLCGPQWRKAESSLQYAHLATLDLFLAMAGDQALLADEVVDEEIVGKGLAEMVRPRLEKARREQFASLVSDLPFLHSQMNEEWAEKLDQAANRAYEQVGRDLVKKGGVSFEESDIGHSPDEWKEVLEKVLEYRDFPQLSSFILPCSRWNALRRVDYCRSFEDDIVDALQSCHLDIRRGGGRWLEGRDFRMGLQIWLSPRLALETPEWRDCAGRLLSDCQSARAIRYAALRLRAARSTGGSS